MLPGLLAGAGMAAGCLLVVRGLAPPPPPLSAALARTLRPPMALGEGGPLRRLAVRWVPPARDPLAHDLRVLGRDVARHAVEKLAAAWVLALCAAATGALLAAGGVRVSWPLVGLAALGAAAAGFVLPDLTARSEAARRRREFAEGLGAYLELVVIVLAGGGGTETALHDAARAGDGWVFAEIGRALDTARLTGTPPWSALDDLGRELGVGELRELAASVTLAGEQGARVRASLSAKAHSMREHRLAGIRARAEQATEKMSIPTVLMLFGFVAFVLYPALDFVLAGL